MINKSTKKGFSLVELLVVITIIAILSVVAYTAVSGQTAKARNSRRMQDLSAIQSAMEIYFIENNYYPTVLDDGNTADPETDLVPKYMPKIPKDPSSPESGPSKPYSYNHDGNLKTYQLSSTQETEVAPFVKAYLIGNGASLITGVNADKTPGSCTVSDGSTTCVPYNL